MGNDKPLEELNIWFKSTMRCPKCSGEAKYRIWESSCGGYEDYNYKCQECDHNWWIDGSDS